MSELRRRVEQLLERLAPRERLLLGVAAVVSVLLVLWMVSSALAERHQRLLAQIAAGERDLAEVAALRDRYLRLRAEHEAIERRLAVADSDTSLFAHLESVAREVLSRERISAMNPSTRTISDTLQEEQVELRLAGVSLRDLVALLYRVEKGELPLVVSRLQTKKRFDQPHVLDATLVVGRLRPSSGTATP